MDPSAACNFSLLHLDTHNLALLIIFTVELLQWTRTEVHTNLPTSYCYCFVPGKGWVLVSARRVGILTDSFRVSSECHETCHDSTSSYATLTYNHIPFKSLFTKYHIVSDVTLLHK